MFPTLKPNQDILSFNWAYFRRKPQVGDIVIVKVKGREIVKRVTKILDGEFWIEGDNKKMSTDSESFGPISRTQIIGKVIWY